MKNSIRYKLAKSLMRRFPVIPKKMDLSLHEIFHDKCYTEAEPATKKIIREQSAQFRYDYERTAISLFDKYFPGIDQQRFVGKTVLDLGSFTGGRLVYWMERYKFEKGVGIDINPIFAQAGNEFANLHGVNARFETGYGENLPYHDDTFDFIVTYDVLEHVQNVERVVNECYRVLKPGGILMVVFPQFFQPMEAHLGLVTSLPALHWFFPGKILAAAYHDVISERGADATWYASDKMTLNEWELLPTLNGITVKHFRKIISLNKGWNVKYKNKSPILSDGRRAKKLLFRLLRLTFVIPARVPILEELFLGRISWAIEKLQSEQNK